MGAGGASAQRLADMPPPPSAPPLLRTVSAMPKATAFREREPEPEVEENDIVRVSTSLITVPAEVLDRSGRYIGSLQKEDFRVYENGVEQQVAYFASVEQPFTVALLWSAKAPVAVLPSPVLLLSSANAPLAVLS